MRRLLLILMVLGVGAATVPRSAASTPSLPGPYSHFTANVQVAVEGAFIVLHTNDVPNHDSCYFPESSPHYRPYPGVHLNPNEIETQSITFRLPLSPAEAAPHQRTPLGAIGISLNGVVFFNQYAAGYSPLTREINTLDQYNGHPQMSGVYHYHIEPTYLTQTLGRTALLGFLLDGCPVYGPDENGHTLTNADLDSFHGHFGPTADYPQGIYHYHVTTEDPYINGGQFYGRPGSVTQ